MVNQQNLDSLTGNAGVQMRFPFELGGTLYSPFIDVTANTISPVPHARSRHSRDSAAASGANPGFGRNGTYGKVAARAWPRELAGMSVRRLTPRPPSRARAETASPSTAGSRWIYSEIRLSASAPVILEEGWLVSGSWQKSGQALAANGEVASFPRKRM